MFSNRIKSIEPSPIIKFLNLAKSLEKKHIKVYKLNIAEPDLCTDLSYFHALKRRKICCNGYSNPQGIKELRKEMAIYCNSKIKNNIYTENNILVSNGASDGIIKTLLTICDCNDEIIVVEPFFSDYKIYGKLLNIKLKYIKYNELRNKKKLMNLVNQHTKAILFGNPNNPDGKAIEEKEIENVISVAKQKNLFVISDEVYSEIIYNNEYKTLLQYNYENIVVIDSMSKKFCNCGIRIGFVICNNEEFMKMIVKINDSKISISNTEQFGALNMLKNRNKIMNGIRRIYQKRLKLVLNELQKIDYINCFIPDGGFSVLLTLPIEDCDNFCSWLLTDFSYHKSTLLLTPAKDFYLSSEGKNKVRMTITLKSEELKKAIKLLSYALKIYKKKIAKVSD